MIVDRNGMQAMGETATILDMKDLASKFKNGCSQREKSDMIKVWWEKNTKQM